MVSKPYTRDLEVFIALANLLPDDSFQSREPGTAQPVDLPKIYERVLDAFPGPVDPRASASPGAFQIAQRIPQLSVGGRTFHLAERAAGDVERLAQVHDLLVVLRGALGALTVPGSIGIYPGGEYRSPKEADPPSTPAALPIPIREERRIVVEDGRVRVQPSVLTDGFLGALDGAPIDRLRRCFNCGAFFLAKRKDKGGCSPSCCNTLNVRAHRRRVEEGRYTEARKESKKRTREREERRARLKQTKAKV